MGFAARLLLALWLPLVGAGGLAADDLVAVPPLKARVTDLAGTLSSEQAAVLEADLAQFEKSRGSQIAILLLPSTQPESIEAYGIRVADAWKIGRQGVDDGVVVLVARDDRALRIEVGRGLEGALPDAVAKRIIEEAMLPRFRSGDYFGGLQDGVSQIKATIAGEPLPPPRKRVQDAAAGSWEDLLPLAMLFVFVGGGLLRALFGRLLGGALAGGVAFFGGWLLLGSASVALVVALVVFFLTLSGIAGAHGLRGYGGRGGSGGGFSGGGGGFGGGGASGRW
jgi:uncharacterized protein